MITKVERRVPGRVILTAEFFDGDHDRIKVWLKEEWDRVAVPMFWRYHTVDGSLIVIIGPPLDHVANID